MQIEFTWDSAKAKKNLSKHGVSFEIAQEVFYDPMVIGRTGKQQLLAVICLDLSSNEEQYFRIISAWETGDYEQRAYADQFPKGH